VAPTRPLRSDTPPTSLHCSPVESTSEPIESLIDTPPEGLLSRAPRGFVTHPPEALVPRSAPPSWPGRLGSGRLGAAAATWSSVRFAVTVFMATRVVLLVVALVNGALRHIPLTNEFANWDGFWYRMISNQGYPDHVFRLKQTTLGFFPLYPLVSKAFSYLFEWSTPYGSIGAVTVAGVLVSTVGGLGATVLVQRMATDWWDAQTGRRAVLLFCLFPGSVVFSMVYAEGLAIPLAAGCIYALSRRRWVLAGVLAALATAAEPEALILSVVCAVSALLELRRTGWRLRAAWRSFWAPIISPLGAVAFGAYLWVHTGSPLASFTAQHDAWHEKTSPLALVHDASLLATQSHTNLNYVVGLVGAVLLIVMLVLLYKQRRRVPVEAIVWTLGIAFLTVTSWNIPPNPRLLITAFPLVGVVAYYVRGKWFRALLGANCALLIVLSALTFIGLTLRP
jgi:hypothetical protein